LPYLSTFQALAFFQKKSISDLFNFSCNLLTEQAKVTQSRKNASSFEGNQDILSCGLLARMN